MRDGGEATRLIEAICPEKTGYNLCGRGKHYSESGCWEGGCDGGGGVKMEVWFKMWWNNPATNDYQVDPAIQAKRNPSKLLSRDRPFTLTHAPLFCPPAPVLYLSSLG